jgi:peptidoglycan hydrolase-like protein with peptidoglycan-binding domain
MRQSRGIIGWLPVVLLTACVASQTGESTALRPATDRLLTAGDIHIAEEHLQAFGFDPGPVDGLFTAQTQAAVRAFQARYGLPVSGLLDRATRAKLQLGVGAKGGN